MFFWFVADLPAMADFGFVLFRDPGRALRRLKAPAWGRFPQRLCLQAIS
jgi:hypothetical protein